MRVHAARHDDQAGCVDHALALEIGADFGNRFADDADIGDIGLARRDDRSAANHQIVRHSNLLQTKKGSAVALPHATEFCG